MPLGVACICDMEWLFDPTIWLGLATLIVLEIVLGIDNLIFISILAEKLPPEQRQKARLIGLSLALLMRIALLATISWLVKLTAPLIFIFDHALSGRDLILLGGGLFLLFKATVEISERLDGVVHHASGKQVYARFGAVIVQIVVLDAVFSLDAVITAVGMVDDLPVMVAAVVIAMLVMIAASGPLMRFVNTHPSVVMLCLGFLLMIGLSLVADGLGFKIPKGYLYAAIGFSVLIEGFNQWRHRNVTKHAQRLPLRERTAEAVLRLLGGNERAAALTADSSSPAMISSDAFEPEEKEMVTGVLTLAERPVNTIMTPRPDVHWVDLSDDHDTLLDNVRQAPHSLLLVCEKDLDHIRGVGRSSILIADLLGRGDIDRANSLFQPVFVHEDTSVLALLRIFRRTRAQIAIVTDSHGSVDGVVTPVDVLEAIAGELPEMDDEISGALVLETAEGWVADGRTEVFRLRQLISAEICEDAEEDFDALASYLFSKSEKMPFEGDELVSGSYRFIIRKVRARRIAQVLIRKLDAAAESRSD